MSQPINKLVLLFTFTVIPSLFVSFNPRPAGAEPTIANAVTPATVRFASFNASLNRKKAGDLIRDLSTPDNEQARKVAAIVQTIDADVLALLEFDYDAEGKALRLFQENYLSAGRQGARPVTYPYHYIVPSNTGVLSGADLNNDGAVSLPQDAFGFGFFPGQFAFVILSKYPIQEEKTRTFQKFRWKDMPGAKLPANPDGSSYYSAEALEVFRLSSKNHVDVPVVLPGGTVVHVLVAHPTPPVFDGPEDRNGTRNHDEIRLLCDYVKNERYLYDDNGTRGGLKAGEHFVIMGDMNADPFEGDATDNPVDLFKTNPRINQDVLTGPHIPASRGGTEAAATQGGANQTHKGDPAHDTGDFNDRNPGNLRIDYILPSAGTPVKEAGVFWPETSDVASSLAGASDHRLVWMDLVYD